MEDNFNIVGKKTGPQPYDSRIKEMCEKCQNDLVYRRSSFFGNKTYYKICNTCGWYQVLSKDVWKERINRTKPSKTPAELGE